MLPATSPYPVTAPATGADAVISTLTGAGVQLAFGYPGGAIMPIYDALHRAQRDLRHVLVRHEQAAVHAAAGYARASGAVAACFGTSGPGATNMLTGLADALMDSTPVLAITGQVASPLLGSDAFQEADVVSMSLAATKWSYQITSPEEVEWAIREGLAIARGGRPGPVLIDITKDAQVAPVDARRRAPAPTPAEASRVTSDRVEALPVEHALEQAAGALAGAERPLVLAGHGVSIAGAEDALLALAERLDAPVACTLLGLSCLPADHPLNVGMLGMHGNFGPNVLTNEADVILAVGMRFDDRVTGRLDGYAPTAQIIHIDIDPAEIGKNVPTAVGIVADAREALTALTRRVETARHPTWRRAFERHAEIERDAVMRPVFEAITPELNMGEVVARISERTDGEAIVVSDVGQHQMHAARYYRFRNPRSHITSGGLGTMGFGLPAAIGASFARPDRAVLCMVGDGGFQMNIQELGTVMQEGSPVKIVILNNGYLGMVRQWQQLFFDGRYSAVNLENPDFVKLADGYGIQGERVEGRARLPAALDRMLRTPGPYLLDVVVAQEENVFPMVPAGETIDAIRLS